MDFTDRLYAGMSRADVIAAKTNPREKQVRSFATYNSGGKVVISAEECKALCKACNDLKYWEGAENRIRQYRITDDTVDRYGDIVRAFGILLANYKKNPVVQFAHDYSQPPIGNAIKIWYDDMEKAVYAWAMFFDLSIDTTGRSDLIFRMASANAMNACSIGFIPIQYNDPSSEMERKRIGLGKYGVEYVQSDLTEFSPVPVPANPKALQNSFVSQCRKGLQASLRSGLFTKQDADIMRKYGANYSSAVIDMFIKELDANKQVLLETVPETKNKGEENNEAENENEREGKDTSEESIEKEIIAFLRANPEPEDEEVHALAEKIGVEVDEVEEVFYKLAAGYAKMKQKFDYTVSVDEAKLAAGTTVELEHMIDNSDESMDVAECIAYAHLVEDENYYEKLVSIESEKGIDKYKINMVAHMDTSAIQNELNELSKNVKSEFEQLTQTVRESLGHIHREADAALDTARKAAALVEQRVSEKRLYDALGLQTSRKKI